MPLKPERVRPRDLVPESNRCFITLDPDIHKLVLQVNDPLLQLFDPCHVRRDGLKGQCADLQRRIDAFPCPQNGLCLFESIGWIEFLSHVIVVLSYDSLEECIAMFEGWYFGSM